MSNIIPKYFSFLSLVVLLLILLPLIIIIPLSLSAANTLNFPPQNLSLRWYKTIFSDVGWRTAIFNSLMVAAATTGLTAVIFVPAGVFLGLAKNFQWLTSIFMSPFILPPLVLAIGFYSSFGELRNTFWALPLAHSVFASPIVVLLLRNITRIISRSSLEAAAVHGANYWQIIRNIVLPQITPAIAASCLFAFLLSFNEPIFSLYLATPWYQTLPLKVWGSLRFNISPATAAVGAMSIFISTVGLLLISILLSRSLKHARL